MVKKSEEVKEREERKDFFGLWAESSAAFSKVCEESFSNVCKPWLESTGEMFDRAIEITRDSTPQKYKEFYDEWVKTYQNTFGKFYPVTTLKSNKETLEKFLNCAEESNKIYKSWITELEENSKATREVLKGELDPAKSKECYDMWMRSYEKIFDQTLELPAMELTKEIYGNYAGIPEIYLSSFVQMLKLWKNSYTTVYGPWIESMFKLSGKMAELSKGEAGPEAYKEFYNLWMDAYKETYGKYVQSVQPSKEVFDNFAKSTSIYLNMYRSWAAALEKMLEKAKELSKQTADPETSKEFYNLWIKMYEKSFNNFFEDMPAVGSMKEMMAPMKNAARIYSDTFASMSRMWMKSSFGSGSQV